MKKFVFSLKKMRDYKRQILEREKGYLMSLYSEYNQLEERYNMLNDDMRNLCLSSEDDMRKGISVREIQIYEMKKISIRDEQAHLRIQMNVMEGSIEKQRKVVIKYSQEISGLDKLEEKQREEYIYNLGKESERDIEEFLSFKLTKSKESEYYESDIH
ncbi:MAG: flagellar FliJ family protein [Oscillospiraceae bacterium]|nr:flagellar FliJ family protein [Oscillospiraceae bacterium]